MAPGFRLGCYDWGMHIWSVFTFILVSFIAFLGSDVNVIFAQAHPDVMKYNLNDGLEAQLCLGL